MRTARSILAMLCVAMVSACAAQYQLPGPATTEPTLAAQEWKTADGVTLPMRSWQPEGQPKAVILALHGMNDYSNFFDEPGQYLAKRGIASYAYDQRGFGAAPRPGIWSSSTAMAADARAAAALLVAHHPGVPVYLLGESMGGAVTMLAAADGLPPGVNGVILSAPAVWTRASMGFFQRTALWLAYQVAPGWRLTGEGLRIQPSDNIPMLRKLAADPLVIKGTRVDAIHGLVDLMDSANAAAPRLTAPALVLYGERDEVIPDDPVWAMVRTLPDLGGRQRVAFYPSGYHMLLRDLKANTVLDDVIVWITDPAAALPSGADTYAREMLTRRTDG